jgi:hypothetical protein
LTSIRSSDRPAARIRERVDAPEAHKGLARLWRVNAFHLPQPLARIVIAVVLCALQSTPMSAAENLADVLRGFRTAPAGFVRENLQNLAAALPAPTGRQSLNGYAAWAAEVFTADELANPHMSGPDAVRAADGLTNLDKYALGLNPHVAACAADLPECGQLDDHWFLWYRRPSDTDDVEYRVEVSTDDGATWSSAGVTQEPILANDLAQSWQAHYHAAPGEAVRLRLALTLR